ncbi:MAG: Cytokinin riboside 5'-monophosphate phosphoribohydrolase [Chlamydiae bacterium]|nr:Cytokinin riboside 5'-monophosphate phosphoribohydrolase [Chlamydiota bacterium]
MSVPRKPHFDSWRIFRILSEFVDGFETMTDIGPSVSIFGSARTDPSRPYYKLGTEVAEKIAKKGIGIITGGGGGIMEAANKGAQNVKGRSCGMSINLPFEETSNPYLDRKYDLRFRYFFVRKVMFVRYAQAFVVLPGGVGTLDELFEAMTLIQTKKIKPFPIFLMGKSYWEGLIEWLKAVPLQEKYISQTDFDLFTLTDDPQEVADAIERHYQKVGKAPTFPLGTEDEY